MCPKPNGRRNSSSSDTDTALFWYSAETQKKHPTANVVFMSQASLTLKIMMIQIILQAISWCLVALHATGYAGLLDTFAFWTA